MRIGIAAENADAGVTPAAVRGNTVTGPTRRVNGFFNQTVEGPDAVICSLVFGLVLLGGEALWFDRCCAPAVLAPLVAATAIPVPPWVAEPLESFRSFMFDLVHDARAARRIRASRLCTDQLPSQRFLLICDVIVMS